MITNARIDGLLDLLLQARRDVVARVERPVAAGEPPDLKHKEILALQEQAHRYAAELAGIIGKDETAHQWALLGRIAYGLEGSAVSPTLVDVYLS